MESTSALLNELALVVQAVAEPTAFAPVYDHYFPRVYNYVRYRVRDPQTTDDLTAIIFERTLVNLSRYRSEQAPFSAWLFSIARNAVNDHFRVQKRRPWLSFDSLRDHADETGVPEVIADQRAEHERLLAAVAGLKERERDLVGLKFGAGLSNRHIAALTGLSESNVAVILYRTLQQLRTALKDEG